MVRFSIRLIIQQLDFHPIGKIEPDLLKLKGFYLVTTSSTPSTTAIHYQ